ncbi:MAG: hypothetical protein H6815_05895 [Phycisphaeraceae bacterium]|nr:hypothetical protein [Phycisphaerales bacterium]MCB9859971.1 hypothetical protein [Phycisphaeraceae bacterium]
MSQQFGMQMAGAASRGNRIDIYTGLLLFACIALGLGCAWMWGAGSALSPDGNPLHLQDANNVMFKSK